MEDRHQFVLSELFVNGGDVTCDRSPQRKPSLPASLRTAL
jgi:hypothetical protein